MRRFLFYVGLTILCAFAAGDARAAPTPPVAVRLPQNALQDNFLAEASRIAPHRAVYTMTLASVKNGSNISDVSGHLLFEWQNVCTGWAIQQHMQLHFAYTEGDDQDITSTELTWESKDGKQYTFNIHHTTNGQETENYRGKATQNADGSVSVVYTSPKDKVVQLPAGTLFPSAHTELILQKAAEAQTSGERLFTRRVFDGSDKAGSSDISAFVMPQRPIGEATGLDSKLKKNPLLAEAAWPVHLAFFAPDDETGEPDYEMDLTLLPNGIARHMKIDYGDFAVIGDLADVESLPAQRCP